MRFQIRKTTQLLPLSFAAGAPKTQGWALGAHEEICGTFGALQTGIYTVSLYCLEWAPPRLA